MSGLPENWPLIDREWRCGDWVYLGGGHDKPARVVRVVNRWQYPSVPGCPWFYRLKTGMQGTQTAFERLGWRLMQWEDVE